MLRFIGAQVIVLEDDFGNVSIHSKSNGACLIVPSEVNAGKFRSSPIHGNLIVLAKSSEKMFCMLFTNVFDSEVIDNEHKGDWSPSVPPIARGCS